MIGTPVSSAGHPAPSSRSTHPRKRSSKLAKPRTRRIKSSAKGASYDRILRPESGSNLDFASRPEKNPTVLGRREGLTSRRNTSMTAHRIVATYRRSLSFLLQIRRFSVTG